MLALGMHSTKASGVHVLIPPAKAYPPLHSHAPNFESLDTKPSANPGIVAVTCTSQISSIHFDSWSTALSAILSSSS